MNHAECPAASGFFNSLLEMIKALEEEEAEEEGQDASAAEKSAA